MADQKSKFHTVAYLFSGTDKNGQTYYSGSVDEKGVLDATDSAGNQCKLPIGTNITIHANRMEGKKPGAPTHRAVVILPADKVNPKAPATAEEAEAAAAATE